MTSEGLGRVAVATRAVYLRETARIRDILADETALRGRLARLDAAVIRSRQDLSVDTTMRCLGADILWQGWEARTRRQLNIELAQVRARKLAALDQVRRAFGRQQAVQAMLDAQTAQRKASLARLRETRLLNPARPYPD